VSLLARIAAVNHADPRSFRPFEIAGQRVGWVHHGFAARLAAHGGVFEVTAEALRLHSRHWAFEARSQVLEEVVRALVDEGTLPRLHGERYPVTASTRDRAVCTIDRAAAAWFGVRAFGQHLNGFVRRPDGLWLWVARRALHKWNFPGRLDQLVAGGLPYDMTLAENLVKECAEEAGLDAAHVAEARPVGSISYCLETHEGLKRDVIYCYDLELDETFVPRPVDGEVEVFELWPLHKVAETLAVSDDFKPNCALVAIDFLVRHGWLDPGDPDYLDLVTGLHRPPELSVR
jgi:8-oxo-dGTP pyrophosphatase MutT (NUDIX family)